MNNTFKTPFTFLAFLLAFSFSLQSFGQPPSVRKESEDGGTGSSGQAPTNCISNDGSGGYFTYEITSGEPYPQESCDLAVIVEQTGSSPLTILANNFVFDSTEGLYIFTFSIFFTGQQVASLCAGNDYYFSMNLTCLGDEGSRFTNNPNPNSLLPTLCCDEETTIPGDVRPIYSGFNSNEGTSAFKVNNSNDSFNKTNTSAVQLPFVDYYILDVQGNQVDLLLKESIETPLSQILSSSNLKTGIYLVRFWDGIEVKTEKVFKL